MTDKAAINVRVNKDTKQNAEKVLNNLGIPMSVAIDIYLKQIALTESIPFDLSSQKRKPQNEHDTAMMVAEATAQYEVTKNNWEDKLNALTPAWMNMNKMSKQELENRLDKHAKEMEKGNYIDSKQAFEKLDKELSFNNHTGK